MNFIISAATDVGIKKNTNQDSLSLKIINTSQGRMAFGVLCDGMGGLEKGEVASATVINAFQKWVDEELPSISNKAIDEEVISAGWNHIIASMNEKIKNYGIYHNIKLGTTVTAILLTESKYYILNVGDSRIYEITDQVVQLTKDQTLVQREVDLGNLTPQQAEEDPRKNILLQCVGASDKVYPDMFFGETKKDAVYMLCSDGFRHLITNTEIHKALNPDVARDEETMQNNQLSLIVLNKMRQETDNISVASIRTY